MYNGLENEASRCISQRDDDDSNFPQLLQPKQWQKITTAARVLHVANEAVHEQSLKIN